MSTYPVLRGEIGTVNPVVAAMAHEVYSKCGGSGQSLAKVIERGGFSTDEMIAFLYARNFPASEWHARVAEAFRGMTRR